MIDIVEIVSRGSDRELFDQLAANYRIASIPQKLKLLVVFNTLLSEGRLCEEISYSVTLALEKSKTTNTYITLFYSIYKSI